MLLKKLFLSTLCFITMTIPMSLYPRSIRNILTLGGTALLTALHYSLSYGINGLGVYNNLRSKNLDSLDNAPESVQVFIRKQLKNTPLENIEHIHIKIDPKEQNFFISARGSDCIVVAGYEKDGIITCELEQLLKEEKNNPQPHITKAINAYTFFVHHEANHLIHDDTSHRAQLAAALPFIMEGALFVARKNCKMPLKLWIRNGLKIPLGFCKGFLNLLCLSAYTRNLEGRADKEVTINDPTVLDDTAFIFRNIPTLPIPLILSTHPTNISRAENLEKLSEELKKTSSNIQKNK